MGNSVDKRSRLLVSAVEELQDAKEILISQTLSDEKLDFTNLMNLIKDDQPEMDPSTFRQMMFDFHSPVHLAALLELILNWMSDKGWSTLDCIKLIQRFVSMNEDLGFPVLRLSLGVKRIGIPGTLSALPNESLALKTRISIHEDNQISTQHNFCSKMANIFWIGDEKTFSNIVAMYFKEQDAHAEAYFTLFDVHLTHPNSMFRGLNTFQIGQKIIEATVGLPYHQKGTDSLCHLLKCELFQDMFIRINNCSMNALFHEKVMSLNTELNAFKISGFIFQKYRKLIEQHNFAAVRFPERYKTIPDEFIVDQCLILLLAHKAFGRINFTELYQFPHLKDIIRTSIRLMIVEGIIDDVKQILLKEKFFNGVESFSIYKFLPNFTSIIASTGDLDLLLHVEDEFQHFAALLSQNAWSVKKRHFMGPMSNLGFRDEDIKSHKYVGTGIFSLEADKEFDHVVHFGALLNQNVDNQLFGSAIFSSVANCELEISNYLLQKELDEGQLIPESVDIFIANVTRFCDCGKLNADQKLAIGEFLQKLEASEMKKPHLW